MKEEKIRTREDCECIITGYEPMSNNRFVIKFDDKFNINPCEITSCSRPKYELNVGWCDMIITIVCIVISPTTKYLLNYCNEKNEIHDIAFSIDMLDPTGISVESWLVNGNIKLIDFGDLDYGVSDMTKIKIIITPTNVMLI